MADPATAATVAGMSTGVGLTAIGAGLAIAGGAIGTLTATAGINLVQPLLKNFWIDSSRASILVAKKTIQYDELGFMLAVMAALYQIMSYAKYYEMTKEIRKK